MSKRARWRTVKTQMEYRIVRHFIRVCTICWDEIDLQRNKCNLFGNYILWTLNRCHFTHDVASDSDIRQCNKIDKLLVVYRFSGITLRKIRKHLDVFTHKIKKNMLHSCSCIIEFIYSLRKRDKMLEKPRIYLFSQTRLINSIKHEHSCKIFYYMYRL